MGPAAAAWPACTLALHLGIEMPKPVMTRWMIGIAFAAVAVLGIVSVWQARSAGDNQPARSAIGEPSDKPRRQQELRFLKAAFDRLEAEAKQNPTSPGLRSLQAEQQAVVLRMREVAHPLRAESVPEEVRALVGAAPAPTTASVGTPASTEAPAKDQPRPAVSAAPANPAMVEAPPRELKAGLGSASADPTLVLSRDPALSGLVLIVRPRPPRPASDAPAEKSAERQPANANAEAKPAAKAPVTVRSPERALPSGTVGTIERPGSGPVAILGR